jgi:hypothetical protein
VAVAALNVRPVPKLELLPADSVVLQPLTADGTELHPGIIHTHLDLDLHQKRV